MSRYQSQPGFQKSRYTAVSIEVVDKERGQAYATILKVIMGNGAFTVV